MEIKGPVAIAGFILSLSKSSGTRVPKVLANMTMINRLAETAIVIFWSPSVK
jgi:hypothetical protein